MTIIEIRNVAKSRKPWKCDGCRRHFEAGTPKERQRLVGSDGAYSIQWCRTCRGIARELLEADRWLYPEGVSADHLQEFMHETFMTWEAADAHFHQYGDGK